MKILFLDIDGVCNNPQILEAAGTRIAIGDEQLKRLKRIVDATGVKLVLSSSWKHRYRHEVERRLAEHGMELIDQTPSKMSSSRGQEIIWWLTENKTKNNVTKFAILDDDPKADVGNGSFFQTDTDVGLTDIEADAAIAYLGDATDA